MAKWTARDLEGTAFVLRIAIAFDNRQGQALDTYRVVEVPPTFNLRKLHDTIRVIFSWGGGHCHEFRTEADGRIYVPWDQVDNVRDGAFTEAEAKLICDETRKKLFAALGEVGAELVYEYDLGDGHEHIITLIDVVYCEIDRCGRPRLVEGAGFRPAEDGVFYEPVRSIDSINVELGRIKWW